MEETNKEDSERLMEDLTPVLVHVQGTVSGISHHVSRLRDDMEAVRITLEENEQERQKLA